MVRGGKLTVGGEETSRAACCSARRPVCRPPPLAQQNVRPGPNTPSFHRPNFSIRPADPGSGRTSRESGRAAGQSACGTGSHTSRSKGCLPGLAGPSDSHTLDRTRRRLHFYIGQIRQKPPAVGQGRRLRACAQRREEQVEAQTVPDARLSPTSRRPADVRRGCRPSERWQMRDLLPKRGLLLAWATTAFFYVGDGAGTS